MATTAKIRLYGDTAVKTPVKASTAKIRLYSAPAPGESKSSVTKQGTDVSSHAFNPLNANSQFTQPSKGPQMEYKPEDNTKLQLHPLEAIKQILPNTTQSLTDLKNDPLNSKNTKILDPANAYHLGPITIPKETAKKALSASWDVLKGSVMQEGDRIKQLFDPKVPLTTPQGASNAVKVFTGALNIPFSAFSALFEGANQIPVLGSVSRLIGSAFTGVGEGATAFSNKVIDELPISQQTKEQLKPAVGELFALATQIVAGKAIDSVTFKKLETKYGTEDAQAMVNKATELAKENPKPTEPFPTSDPTGKARPLEIPKPETEFPKTKSEAVSVPDRVVQTTNEATGEKSFYTIPKVSSKTVIDKIDNAGGTTVRNEAGDNYHVTAKTPEQMTAAGFTHKGEINPDTIPKATTPLIEPKSAKASTDINESLVKKGFDAIPEDQQAKYSPTTKAEQIAKISELMGKNIEKAKSMALGDTPIPNDILPQPLFNAIEAHATETGDIETLRGLAKSPLASQLSEAGQALGSHGYNDNPNSAVSRMREVTKAREEKATKSGLTKEKVKADIRSEIKKAAPKIKDWAGFLDELKCT